MYYDINSKDKIKASAIIILIFFIYLKNINIYKENNIVEIDNNINDSIFENDLDFSGFQTELKIIAIYYPQYLKNDIIYFNNKTKFGINNNTNPLINEYKQARKLFTNIHLGKDKKLSTLIKEQIKLAKNHGIFGFGINYYWFSGQIFDDESINLFLYDNNINFPFFLIWKNDEYFLNNSKIKNTIIIKQDYKKEEIIIFINDIKKYLISEKYININGKPILAIYDPLIIYNLKDYLYNLRQIANERGIGELFILGTLYNDDILYYKELFDAYYEFPPKNLNHTIFQKDKYYYFYQDLIYNVSNNISEKKTNNCNIFKGIMIESNSSSGIKKNHLFFKEYSPEKLYLLTKMIINWTINNHNKNDSFIFINAWNNWEEGNYLEPDNHLGFAFLNSLSKALFNKSFYMSNFNLFDLKNNIIYISEKKIIKKI